MYFFYNFGSVSGPLLRRNGIFALFVPFWGWKCHVWPNFYNCALLWVAVLLVVLNIIIFCIKRKVNSLIYWIITKIVIFPFLTPIRGLPHLDLKFHDFWKIKYSPVIPDNYTFKRKKSKEKACFVIE